MPLVTDASRHGEGHSESGPPAGEAPAAGGRVEKWKQAAQEKQIRDEIEAIKKKQELQQQILELEQKRELLLVIVHLPSSPLNPCLCNVFDT